MSLTRTFPAAPAAITLALTLALTAPLPAQAGSEIAIKDAYAIASGMTASAGAAFFAIENTGDEDDRLIDAKADVAKKVELHTHVISDDGVARMMQVEEGFAVPAGGMHLLQRGGDHVMFMGLTTAFADGTVIPLTLVFEKAGTIEVDVPVDAARAKAAMDAMMNGDGMENDMDHDMDHDMDSGDMESGDMDHGDMNDDMDHGDMDHGDMEKAD